MDPQGWHSRGYLPHFNGGEVPQMVTFRLHGSIPSDLMERIRQTAIRESRENLAAALRMAIERHLDHGSGPQWLLSSAVAAIVENAMLHFDGERYALLSWCIMSNHVHALMLPRHPHDLSSIMSSWKSYSAQKCNQQLGRKGAFWAADYFDRFIRNDEHLTNAIGYIEQNPVKAGACTEPEEWQWSSARRR